MTATRSATCMIPTLLLSATSVVIAQQPPAETIGGMTVPDAWQVSVFASEPMITNPTSIDIDTHGRVWVCEGRYYRGAATNPPADVVKVLEDTDGDGVADEATVFAEGLLAPLGVCVAGATVYVPESPNLYVYEDKDGDLVADAGSKRVLLTGFGGRNHDHTLHGLVLGPDHKLYMTNGDLGLDVTAPDGSRAVSQWGAVLRSELDGTKLEAVATNFRNPYELAVDSFCNIWLSDNDNDGLKSVRLTHILEGGDYGWFGRPLSVRGPDGSFDPMNHFRSYFPGFVPPVLMTGFGSPTGMTFYEGDAFGNALRGKLLHTDAGPREVRAYELASDGAGFSARQQNIVTAEDTYFRPSDICVAPDGSILIADWYDQGVGGHAYNNPEQGRIYRLTPKGKTLQRAEPPGPYDSVEDAIVALGSPNLATQFLAREKLIRAGSEAASALYELTQKGDDILRARAIWVLNHIDSRERGRALAAALEDDDPRFRALAHHVLSRPFLDRYSIALPVRSQTKYGRVDVDPGVQREILAGFGRLTRRLPEWFDALSQPAPDFENADSPEQQARVSAAKHGGEALDELVAVVKQWDGEDRYFLEAVNVSLGRFKEQLAMTLMGRLTSMPMLHQIRLAHVLLPEAAVEATAQQIDAFGVGPDAMLQLVESLGRNRTIAAADLMVRIAGMENLTPDVRGAAIRFLRDNSYDDWKEIRKTQTLKDVVVAALADDALQSAALLFVRDLRDDVFVEPLLAIVEKATDSDQRAELIDALSHYDTQAVRSLLMQEIKSESAAARVTALNAMIRMRSFELLDKVLSDESIAIDMRKDAARQLARMSDGCLFLLVLLEEDRLPDELRDVVVPIAVAHPDVNIRQLFAGYADDVKQQPTISQLDAKRVLSLTGDATHGAALFRDSAANCTSCHRVGMEGKDIGPELSTIGRKYGPEALLDQIQRPAAAVGHDYVPHVIETTDGAYHLGFVQRNDDHAVEIKNEAGKFVTIPKKRVLSIRRQKGTLMPDLLLSAFTEQDVADLVAYLSSLKADRISVKQWMLAAPFANENDEGFETVYAPEHEVDFDAVYEGRGGVTVRWRPFRARLHQGRYYNDLVPAFRKGDHERMVAYFAVYVDSPQSQEATLHIGADDGIKVWVNGDEVFADHGHRQAFPGTFQPKAALVAGRNRVLVKLEQDTGSAGFYFDIATEYPVTCAVK